MLFIFTSSFDTTTDLLIDRLPDVPVFRFNMDLWRDYAWQFTPDGFSVEDPTGRCCDTSSLFLIYQRKPLFSDFIDIPAGGSLENWCREEVLALWRDLYLEYCARGRACLIHPGNGRWGKLRQLWLARRYFRVPEWAAFHGCACPQFPGATISKGLTQTPIGSGKLFFTKEVEPAQLDPEYPWFVQSKVNAQTDVTVAYVSGDLFAFEVDRDTFEGVDCRIDFSGQLEWKPTDLSEAEQSAIRGFMEVTGFSFGRLDFLRENGELIFLELNPNGQWAWLDLEGKHGLLPRIAEEIRREYWWFAADTVPANLPEIVQT